MYYVPKQQNVRKLQEMSEQIHSLLLTWIFPARELHSSREYNWTTTELIVYSKADKLLRRWKNRKHLNRIDSTFNV